MESEFKQFLVKAHQATYASGVKANINENKAEQYNFKEGEFEYVDIYYGGMNFIGCEIVKNGKEPIWGMNYYGHSFKEDFPKEEFLKFFKETISKTQLGILLRGPKMRKYKSWSYRYVYKGSLGNFSAEEIIKYKGKKILQTRFNGGLIKK